MAELDAERIKPNEQLHIIVNKEIDISDLFGWFKTRKIAQQFKEESCREWK